MSFFRFFIFFFYGEDFGYLGKADGDGSIFVKGRGREEIVREMKVRIERGDVGKERREAIEVCFYRWSV